ncbi:hypothetical protein DESA109040_16605 [Deinococcus saxicola]|uniref:hypothetical protein n=1 Tax=Deinococcus saxicola TaxID=249406 RepID=UPI0039EE55A5
MKRNTLRLLVLPVGLASVVIGAGLTIRPQSTSEQLGLPYAPGLTSGLGVVDALLGVALLTGWRTRRWMLVRVLANLGLAALYARHLKNAVHPERTRGGLLMMLILGITDSWLTLQLPGEVEKL